MTFSVVMTCRHYADYLHFTLPYAKRFADELVVVTSPDDAETLAVCNSHGVRALATDAFDRGGGPFNKGAAINEGLASLARDDWVVILDADILVPGFVRPYLENEALRSDTLYGVDRRNCAGRERLDGVRREKAWLALEKMPRVFVANQYPPIGYFQLFHSSFIPCGPWYEESYVFADRTDLTFALRFDRRRWLGTSVVHLDAGNHVGGVNWRGRKSPRFIEPDLLRVELDREIAASCLNV